MRHGSAGVVRASRTNQKTWETKAKTKTKRTQKLEAAMVAGGGVGGGDVAAQPRGGGVEVRLRGVGVVHPSGVGVATRVSAEWGGVGVEERGVGEGQAVRGMRVPWANLGGGGAGEVAGGVERKWIGYNRDGRAKTRLLLGITTERTPRGRKRPRACFDPFDPCLVDRLQAARDL